MFQSLKRLFYNKAAKKSKEILIEYPFFLIFGKSFSWGKNKMETISIGIFSAN